MDKVIFRMVGNDFPKNINGTVNYVQEMLDGSLE